MKSRERPFGFDEVIPPNEDLANYYLVYLNGTIVGVVPRGDKPSQLVDWLIEKRRGELDPSTGISIDHVRQKIFINTDAGRLMVPFVPSRFILDEKERARFNAALVRISAVMASDSPAFDPWEEVLKEGFVELLDPQMIHNATIACSIEDLLSRPTECTHVQLPCAHSGIIMSLVGSADTNKGARNIYICNHWKQGIGGTILNPFTRYLTEMNLMRGPQLPLVRSQFNEIIGLNRYPFCQNVDVAFMANAENQADELIFNQGAIDRGAFLVHHIVSRVIKPESTSAAFGIADFSKVYSPVASMDAYQKVDPVTGTPRVLGEKFKQGDVIAAITEPLSPADIEDLKKAKRVGAKAGESEVVYTKRDISITHTADHCPEERHPSLAYLTAAFEAVGGNNRVRTLQFTTMRYTKEGDKFSSEHGQKGVCGPTRAECDMPYNEDGIRATIVFNPPAAVRRETHGQLAFTILGKICALLGTSLEMTPFLNQVYTDKISGILSELGMDPRGTERMFNPISGEPFIDPIFFGVLAYMRLRRMVDDLRQYRYHGAREFYSRQPVKGAAKHGGVAVGEMERNAIITSGATGVARDCHFEQAAPVDRYICDRCHHLAYPSPTTPGIITCDRCGNLDPAVSHAVRVPYNLPLLSAVLEGASCYLETLTDAACSVPESN